MLNTLTQPLITLDQVTVAKRGTVVLDAVSLTVTVRDFVTIIGPNGAGKSTLLRCMLGNEAIKSGTLTRADDITIGYVPQRFFVPDVVPMTVAGFIALHNHPLRNRLHYKDAEALFAQLGVTAYFHQPMSTLSGGQLQRVLLARALVRRPNLLILDEPTQGLDVTGEIAFYSLLQQIHKQYQLAVVMVSHDLHLVLAASQQVICLYHHVCCSGTPSTIIRDPSFVKLFGRTYVDMMAIYQHTTHTHTHE